MKQMSACAPGADKTAQNEGRKPGSKPVHSHPKKKALGKAIFERVTPVLDTHTALRSPLRNAKWEKFCQALLTAGSAAEAARIAGYSSSGARQEGSRLLTIPDVQRRLAGLFENASHRSILRRRDVLKNASARAAAAITDISGLIGLPWEKFSEQIKYHPSARAIKSVDMGRAYDAATQSWSPPFVKHVELFDPRASERLLSDMLGWEAPKKVEMVAGSRDRIMLPPQKPVELLPMPEGANVS